GRQRGSLRLARRETHDGPRLQVERFLPLVHGRGEPESGAGVEGQPPLDPESSVPLEELAPKSALAGPPARGCEAREYDGGEERRDEATGCGMMSHGSDSTARFSPTASRPPDGTPVTTP